MFDRIIADARNGVQAVFDHIMHVTESELQKTRSYFESELSAARSTIAVLEARIGVLESGKIPASPAPAPAADSVAAKPMAE